MSERRDVADEENIGSVTISLTGDLTIKLVTSGVMEYAPFLAMASDYLAQYKERAWDAQWKSPEEDAVREQE